MTSHRIALAAVSSLVAFTVGCAGAVLTTEALQPAMIALPFLNWTVPVGICPEIVAAKLSDGMPSISVINPGSKPPA